MARYHKIAALAETPTPARRGIAAAIASALAFLIVQTVLGVAFGAGSAALWLSAFGAAVAAAYAAATLKRGTAVVFGLLGVIWLLAEAIGVLFAIVAAGLG